MDDMISPHPHRHQYVGQAALFRPLTAASINGWASQPVPDKYALATDEQTNKQTNRRTVPSLRGPAFAARLNKYSSTDARASLAQALCWFCQLSRCWQNIFCVTRRLLYTTTRASQLISRCRRQKQEAQLSQRGCVMLCVSFQNSDSVARFFCSSRASCHSYKTNRLWRTSGCLVLKPLCF